MRIKSKLISLILVTATIMPLAVAAPALAYDVNNPTGSGSICSVGTAGNSAYCHETSGGGQNKISGPDGAIPIAVNLITIVAGAVAVIVIIVSAIRYVTGGDNPQTTNEARNMIIYALVGIVVIALSWTIASFALNLI